MAFSHAITCNGGRPASRAVSAATMCGATKRRIVGPTAVVTTSASAISATTFSGSDWLFTARKPVTVRSRPPSPTSCTVYSEAALIASTSGAATSENTTS